MEGNMKKRAIMRTIAAVVSISMIFTATAFATPGHNKFGNAYGKYKPVDNDYEGALKQLIEKEIVRGYGNGDYGLSGNVKRGDVIVMIVRMLDRYGIIDKEDYDYEELGKNYLKLFEDVSADEYFYGSVKIAKKLGIAKGDGMYFKPNKPVTIQEVIWLVERAGKLLDVDFETEKIDDLNEIYKDELNDYAKRRDVFWMIYYVMSEQKSDLDNEFDDIKLDIANKAQLDFKDSWFVKVYDSLVSSRNKEKLKYVKFALPDKGGKLYYNYDADRSRNSLVVESTKYYFGYDKDNVVEEISFVSDKNFVGTASIKYTAYTENKSYDGIIKIAVKNQNLDTLSYQVNKNEYINLVKSDFEDFISGVKFEIPDSKAGALYFDKDGDGKPEKGEETGKGTVYERKQLSSLIFKPYQDFTGEVTLKYTGYENYNTKNETAYYGEIKIKVEAVQEIKMLKLNANDDEIKIDFAGELKKLIERNSAIDYDNLKYAAFKLPETGTLKIKLDDKSKTLNVVEDENYKLDDIEYIRYIFEDDGTFDIKYTVYEKAAAAGYKAYNGTIRIIAE